MLSSSQWPCAPRPNRGKTFVNQLCVSFVFLLSIRHHICVDKLKSSIYMSSAWKSITRLPRYIYLCINSGVSNRTSIWAGTVNVLSTLFLAIIHWLLTSITAISMLVQNHPRPAESTKPGTQTRSAWMPACCGFQVHESKMMIVYIVNAQMVFA